MYNTYRFFLLNIQINFFVKFAIMSLVTIVIDTLLRLVYEIL